MLRKSMSPSGERTIALVFLQYMIIAVTTFLMKSSCFIFPLYLELNSFEKSYLQITCLFSEDSTDCQNLWVCKVISSKAVSIFLEYFLSFGLYTFEKQGIINLSSNSSKKYEFIVLSDSEVTFLGEGKNAIFRLFLCYVLFIDCWA